jgi:peptide chain release factor 2
LAELASLGDESMTEHVDAECSRLENEIASLTAVAATPAGPDDRKAAYLAIKAGSGGREACNWAEMLLRMYAKRVAKLGLSAEFVDFSPNEPDGIKTAVLRIEGDNAFGRLKDETGVHRLSRVSPFDQADRRQTSFAAVEVVPEAARTEGDVMEDKDLEIDFCCGGGPGGQNVNKRETTCVIKHVPTGLGVRCQNERTQEANKAMALELLRAKLLKRKKQQEEDANRLAAKSRPQASFGNEYRRTYVLSQHPRCDCHMTGNSTLRVWDVLDGDFEGLDL